MEDLFPLAHIPEGQAIKTLPAEDVRVAAQAFFQALWRGLRADDTWTRRSTNSAIIEGRVWHMPGPNYDNILKRIAMQAPDAFFAWLARIVGIAAAVVEDSSLSTELPTAVRYVDLAWLIRAGNERVILHIEFQLEPGQEPHS